MLYIIDVIILEDTIHKKDILVYLVVFPVPSRFKTLFVVVFQMPCWVKTLLVVISCHVWSHTSVHLS